MKAWTPNLQVVTRQVVIYNKAHSWCGVDKDLATWLDVLGQEFV